MTEGIFKLYPLLKHLDETKNEYGVYNKYGGFNNIKTVIVFNFKSVDDGYIFVDQTVEEFTGAKNQSKYCYIQRDAASNIVFPSLYIPQIKVGLGDREKQFRALISFFNESTYKLDKQLCALKSVILSNESHVKQVFAQNQHNPTLYTITIDGKYIGEHPMFDIVRTRIKEEVLSPDKHHHVGQCSLCKEVTAVYGSLSPFNYYTYQTDKSVKFKFSDAYKSKAFPVCLSCGRKLSFVSDRIEDRNLNFKNRFCGFEYVIIPEFLIDSPSHCAEIMDIFLDKETKINKYSERYGSLTKSDNKDITNALSQTPNIVSYSMIFVESSNAKFTITKSITGIYPNMFKQLYESKSLIENIDMFKITSRKDCRGEDITLTFESLKDIIKTPNNKHDTKIFYYITKLFEMSKINYNDFMIRALINLRVTFFENKHDKLYKMCLSTLQWLLYFKTLKMIDEELIIMDYDELGTPKFKNSTSEFVYYVGCLSRYVETIQSAKKGSSPIRSSYKGLRLNLKDVKSLYVKVYNKLLEHDGGDYRYGSYLVERISSLATLELSELSIADISFIFTVGLCQGDSEKQKYNEQTKGEQTNVTE